MTQQRLPNDLRVTFQDVLRPELIAILRENIPALNSEMLEHYQQRQSRTHEALASRLSEHYDGISSDINKIRLQLKSSNPPTQGRLEYAIQDRNVRPEDNLLIALLEDQRSHPSASLKEHNVLPPNPNKVGDDYESLREM
jgi:hypothetical protein